LGVLALINASRVGIYDWINKLFGAAA